jgi:hypothetical protein
MCRKPETCNQIENRTQKTLRNRHSPSAIAISNFVLPLLPTFHGLDSSHLRLFSHRPSPIARRPSLLRNHLRANRISMRYLTDSRSEALLLGSHGHCTRPPFLLLSIAFLSSLVTYQHWPFPSPQSLSVPDLGTASIGLRHSVSRWLAFAFPFLPASPTLPEASRPSVRLLRCRDRWTSFYIIIAGPLLACNSCNVFLTLCNVYSTCT